MKCTVLVFGLVANLAAVAAAQPRPPMNAAALFGKGPAVGHDAELVTPIHAALFTDGSLGIVDFGRFDVTRIAPDGKVRWRSGRKGRGPGEFLQPARLIALEDSSLYVLDAGRLGAVTHLTRDGTYLEELSSDMQLRVDNMLLMPNGQIAMLGTTDDPRGSGGVIHILTKRLRHVRSFGRLPAMKDPRVLTAFGPGGLTLTMDGHLLHTRFYPYEISKYTTEGIEVSRLRVPVKVASPEEYVRLDVFEGRITRIVVPHLLRPRPAHDLGGGYFLGGRSAGKGSAIDVIGSTGRIVSTMPYPAHLRSLAVIDRTRKVFWFFGEEDDVPVLWRLPFGTVVPQ